MPLNIADLKISSPDFQPGTRLADEFSADGGNAAPRLEITGVPAEAVCRLCSKRCERATPRVPLPTSISTWSK